MSCNRSPSGPVRTIAACAALRISRLAWSGVLRTRLTVSPIFDDCLLTKGPMLTTLSVTLSADVHLAGGSGYATTHQYSPPPYRCHPRSTEPDARPRGHAAGVLADGPAARQDHAAPILPLPADRDWPRSACRASPAIRAA